MEKRKDKRFDVKIAAIIEDDNKIIRGYVRNLSLSGAFFTAYDDMEIKGDNVKFKIIDNYKFLDDLGTKIINKKVIEGARKPNFHYRLNFDENVDKRRDVINPLLESYTFLNLRSVLNEM